MLKNKYQKEKNKMQIVTFVSNLISGAVATAFLGAILYVIWNSLIFGRITYWQAVLMTILIRLIVVIGTVGRK